MDCLVRSFQKIALLRAIIESHWRASIGKEHRSESARHDVERFVRERQLVSGGRAGVNLCQFTVVCFRASGVKPFPQPRRVHVTEPRGRTRAANLSEGSPSPAAMSSTDCPSLVPPSRISASVTGANISRIVSLCRVQYFAVSRHSFRVSFCWFVPASFYP